MKKENKITENEIEENELENEIAENELENEITELEEMNISSKEKEIIESYKDDEDTEIEIVEIEENEPIPEIDINEEKKGFEEYEFNSEEDGYEEFTVENKKKERKKDKKKKNKVENFEIMENEQDVDDDLTIYEEPNNARNHEISKKLNVVFGILIVIISLITIDIISFTSYGNGPFFLIPYHTYKDGSKAYIGLGYKVIEYNQKEGRQDKVLGSWFLKYNTKPVDTNVIDFAIEFTSDETKAYKKYNKQYLKLTGTITAVSEKQNTLTMSFVDTEGGKYSITVICSPANKEVFKKISTNKEQTIVGTMTDYKFKTEVSPSTIYIDNCFIVE